MKISILMPIFSGVEFLHESIKSVITQTHNDWELLIGINGHHIATSKYIENELNKYNDNKIKCFVLQEKNKSKTLNFLCNYTNANYVALLDIDDVWHQDKLKSQIQYLGQYDIVGSNVEYFGDKDGTPNLFLGEISPEMFSWHNPMVNSAVVLKRQDVYWDPKYEGIDDFALWLSLLEKGKTFFNVPEILTYHRISNKSYFNNTDKQLPRSIFENRIPELTERQREILEDIMNNQKWKLK